MKSISRWVELALWVLLIAIADLLALAALLHSPVEVGLLAFFAIIWSQAIWPYVRADGPRHMVLLTDGGRPFYDRRIQAIARAFWGYLRDPNRKASGFPKIEAFWESHLPAS